MANQLSYEISLKEELGKVDQESFQPHATGHWVQNNPLYLETFQQAGTGSEGALRFHYIVHCSLDAVEEKCRSFPEMHVFASFQVILVLGLMVRL